MSKKLFVLVAFAIMVLTGALFAQAQFVSLPAGNYIVSTLDGTTIAVLESANIESTVLLSLSSGSQIRTTGQDTGGAGGSYVSIDMPIAGFIWVLDGGTGVQVAPVQQTEGTFVMPTNLAELPSTMASGMAYQTPSDNCRDVVVVSDSCSTYEGQPTLGEFGLAGNTEELLDERPEALAATGDVVNIRWTPPQGYQGPVFEDEDGNTTVFADIRKITGSNTDVVVIVNNSGEELPLYYDAAFGSFRGFFNLAITKPSWTPELIDNLVGLHSGYMMVKSDPAIAAWIEADPVDEDGPYPQLNPRNCSTVEDIAPNDQVVTYCDVVNVYRGVWNGSSWDLTVGAYGIDRETGQGIWVDLTSVLPQLAAAQ